MSSKAIDISPFRNDPPVKISKGIKALLKKYNQGIKLDLACGANKHGADWVGIDILDLPGVDILQDIETYPWPLPNESVSNVIASHIVEHINPAKFGFINFMNEIWRVMQFNGRLAIATPYAGSPGYFQDPTHVNPCNEATWFYFDPVHSSGLWNIYKSKPWKIIDTFWTNDGNLEVILEKRRVDRTYNDKKD